MADEPRRSGRATKGQHTKDREVTEETPKKKGKAAKSKAKAAAESVEPEESEEIIRCVCGEYEEEEEEPRVMICCDNCSAWQHNVCMGLPEDYAVELYYCEQCKPEQHKDLLAAMKKGEQPWIEAKAKLAALLEESTKTKKGKKGRARKSASARVSEVPATATTEPEEPSPPTSAAGKKRKAEESSSVPDIKPKKARGTPVAETNGAKSTPPSVKQETPSQPPAQPEPSEPVQPEPVSGIAKDVKELPKGRAAVATQIIKIIEQHLKTKKDLKVANAHDSANSIGLQVEQALYHVQGGGAEELNEAYRSQARSITFNLKNNSDLVVRLYKSELLPHVLAKMDPKDMATDEQKQADAKVMKEMEKQHTIIEEQGPRIRRTHKGDEYVDESRQVAAESVTSNAPVRKASISETENAPKSPGVKSPTDIPSPAFSRPRPSIDITRRKSSANFDINKVWSNVQGSPDTTHTADQPVSSSNDFHEPTTQSAKPDAEIDALLKDEEAESPPYSPKGPADDDGTVWHGTVHGGNLGSFAATAKYAAGATPDSDTLRMTYDDLLPSIIAIGGRIQPNKADEYLCGLEYSNTSDLVIVYISQPEGDADKDGFDKLFRYFKNKDRFGVGIQHRNPAIKDIYLIPLEKGEEMPTFVKKLENSFPDPALDRMILVPVVVKNSELPHNQAMQLDGSIQSPSVRGPQVSQTPITPHEPHFEHGVPNAYGPPGVNGNAQPNQSQHANVSTPTPVPSNPPPQAYQAPTVQSSHSPSPYQPALSVINAQRILGPQLANAPAVIALCAQAPNAGENEMQIIKEIIEGRPDAAGNLSVLTECLTRIHDGRRAG